jgi:hypothetical protein
MEDGEIDHARERTFGVCARGELSVKNMKEERKLVHGKEQTR